MKKVKLYESPQVDVMAIQSEGAFLSASEQLREDGMGMKDLTYEDIEWN